MINAVGDTAMVMTSLLITGIESQLCPGREKEVF